MFQVFSARECFRKFYKQRLVWIGFNISVERYFAFLIEQL